MGPREIGVMGAVLDISCVVRKDVSEEIIFELKLKRSRGKAVVRISEGCFRKSNRQVLR